MLFHAVEAECDTPYEEIIGYFSREAVVAVETGRVDSAAFFHSFAAAVGLRWDYHRWIRALQSMYSLNHKGYDLLLDLKDNACTICLLSNIAEYSKLAIQRKFPGLFAVSGHTFLSYELGFHKPQREIFCAVCDALSCAASDCIFLDDVEGNVRGAKSVGMKGLLFSNRFFAATAAQVAGCAAIPMEGLRRSAKWIWERPGSGGWGCDS